MTSGSSSQIVEVVLCVRTAEPGIEAMDDRHVLRDGFEQVDLLDLVHPFTGSRCEPFASDQFLHWDHDVRSRLFSTCRIELELTQGRWNPVMEHEVPHADHPLMQATVHVLPSALVLDRKLPAEVPTSLHDPVAVDPGVYRCEEVEEATLGLVEVPVEGSAVVGVPHGEQERRVLRATEPRCQLLSVTSVSMAMRKSSLVAR